MRRLCPRAETEHRHRHNQFGPPHARSFILMPVVGTALIIHVISSVVVTLIELGRPFGSIARLSVTTSRSLALITLPSTFVPGRRFWRGRYRLGVNFPTRIKSALEYISLVCVNRRQIEIGSLLTSPQCVSEDPIGRR